MQQFDLGKDLLGRSVGEDPSVIHDDDTIRTERLGHMVGDEHNGDALFPVQPDDGVQNLLTASRVQHGGWLVQNDAARLHGDDAGNGDALLLSAGEQMGRVGAVFVHSDRFQGVVHAAADLLRRYAEILRRKGHILLHHVGDQLVVGILKDHANRAADVQKPLLVGGVQSEDVDAAALRQKHGVKMLGKGGFAAAVVAKDCHKAALLNIQVQALKDADRFSFILRRVGEAQLFGGDRIAHRCSVTFRIWSSGRSRRREAPGRCSLQAGPARRKRSARRSAA